VFLVAKASPTGRITYRTNPETTSYSVKAAWKRLAKWSAQHLRQDVGPAAAPASSEAIRDFEKAIGAKLPKDVRDSYRVHNGQCAGGTGIIYGLEVVPLRESLLHWKNWVSGRRQSVRDGSAADFDEDCSSFPHDYVRQVYFDSAWIPLTYDSGGNHIAIDLNPGPKGTRGQVIVFGRDDEFHTVLALSWGQFLTDMADELEAGNFRLDTKDPDYPEFNVDDPFEQHFHSAGIKWSRAKLGLRKLSAADEKPWKKWHGK
jgi:cell wall assembly regulator SMI1